MNKHKERERERSALEVAALWADALGCRKFCCFIDNKGEEWGARAEL